MMNLTEFANALKDGPYAWPGGYPRFFLMADGEALSFAAAEEMRETIEEHIRDDMPADSGWRPDSVAINWEDGELYCAHTGERIESAYAEN